VQLDGYEGIFLKDETQQVSAAFKYRGASAKLSKLDSSKHPVAASTGNHDFGWELTDSAAQLERFGT
jgi:threonine dehydratase